jgi:medium-chain acyl-[acyl-carrier-protein] hydrolase
MRPYLDKPFAIFGHSMGGLVAFELARRLRSRRQPAPTRLLISAHRAPQLRDPDPPIHRLPDSELLTRVQILYGAPQSVLQDPELVELCLPFLRSDFTLCETYVYSSEDPLDCPITVFGGLEDRKASHHQLMAWRAHTRRAFQLRMFPGGHLFLQSAHGLVLKAVTEDLDQVSGRAPGGSERA